VVARLLQHPLALAIAFGLLSFSADTAASFVKRRLRLQPGTEIPGLDQLPEALVPLLVLSHPLGLALLQASRLLLSFCSWTSPSLDCGIRKTARTDSGCLRLCKNHPQVMPLMRFI
jgi:hypothetical protein